MRYRRIFSHANIPKDSIFKLYFWCFLQLFISITHLRKKINGFKNFVILQESVKFKNDLFEH